MAASEPAHPDQARRGRNPRGTLNATQIVEAAGELVGRSGLDQFSMADLARHLGVSVTSVYWHFRSKEELLGALADRVTADVYAGVEDDAHREGDDRVLHYFRSFWARLRVNDLWREVFITTFTRTMAHSPEARARTFHAHHRQITRMVEAGLTLDEATNAHTVLSAYTRGYVLVQHLQEVDAATMAGQELPPELIPGGYLEVQRTSARTTPDENFEAGLKALWSGLLAQSSRAAPPPPRRARRRPPG